MAKRRMSAKMKKKIRRQYDTVSALGQRRSVRKSKGY